MSETPDRGPLEGLAMEALETLRRDDRSGYGILLGLLLIHADLKQTLAEDEKEQSR